MKKRVLSFAMACLMVVSTFIISRPLVNVHAVEVEATVRDLTPVFDGTSRFDTLGNVELAAYHRDAEGGIKDKIYTEGLEVVETTVTVDGVSVPAWAVIDPSLQKTSSQQQFWRGTLNGASTAPINYAGGHHYYSSTSTQQNGLGSALIFTAPNDGKYEFSYSQNSSNLGSWGKAGFEMLILDENGKVLESATVTAKNKTTVITATVNLEKNEVIYIVRVSLPVGVDGVVEENRSSNGAASISIKQLDYIPEAESTTRNLTPIFDGSSRFDTKGNVELAGYHRDVEGTFFDKIYTDNLGVESDGTTWYLRDYTYSSTSQQRIWGGPVNGSLNYAGGHHYGDGTKSGDGQGSVFIFTAPDAGEYEFSYSQKSSYTGNWAPAGFDMMILDADGKVISSATVTAQGKTTVISASVKLKKNEKVYIVRVALKKGVNGIEQENRSSNGEAAFTITQKDYIPKKEGERLDMTPVFDGSSLFDTTGNVELVGYKRDSGIYRDGIQAVKDGSSFYIVDTALPSGTIQRLWIGALNGKITTAGGHHNNGSLNNQEENPITHYGDGQGSALIFTAPRDGKFEFTYQQSSGWTASNKCAFDTIIMDEDGNILNSANFASNNKTSTVSAVVTLKEGEKIYLIRCPRAVNGSTVMTENISTNGGASISIAQLDYINCDDGCDPLNLVAVPRVAPVSHLVPGTAAHYRCTNCNRLWADSAATVSATLETLKITIDNFVEPEKTGHTFYAYKRLKAEKAPAARANTFEAWIKVPTDATDSSLGAIYSNHVDAYAQAINFEIAANGAPQLRWQIQWNKADQITFDDVDVRTGEWLHLVIVRDIENKTGYCYINGKLAQTASFLNGNGHIETLTNTMCVGGGNNSGNSYMFKQSAIHSVAAYSDMRTAEEIASDYANGITEAGEELLAYYIVSGGTNERLRDYSMYENHLTVTNQAMSAVEEKYLPASTSMSVGTEFTWNDVYIADKAASKYPTKVEATVYFHDDFLDGVRGGVIYSDYLGKGNCFTFEINTNGNPRLYVSNGSTAKDIKFTTVNVFNGEVTNLAIEITANAVNLYVNGALKETKNESGIGAFVSGLTPNRAVIVGGDYRERNEQYFKGQLVNVTTYSGSTVTAKYDFSTAASYPETVADKSGNGNTLKHTGHFLDYEIPEDFAYSLLVIGDTQYMNDRYPENFGKIYDWILANKDAHKIEYVMGVGDITDTNDISEWNRAVKQFARLDGVVPYSLVIGNHDKSPEMNAAFNTPEYNATFDGKYGDGIENTYRTITIGKVNYLIMTLEFGYTDGSIAWADEVIAAHPHHNVIITTHSYLAADGSLYQGNTGYNESFNNADELWDKLIRKHENISMVICGHIDPINVVMTEKVGDNGNVVKQILVDPQGIDARHPGGTGMVTLFYFNEDGTEFEVHTYSTVYDGEHYEELSYNSSVNTVDPNHDWNAETGKCDDCGISCNHTVNASDATCQAAAVCATCGYTYEINPDNHAGTATKLVNNGNGTHKVLYTCCDAEVETVDCVFADDDDMICDCGYDRTVDVAEDNFADVFDSIYNGGESDFVAEAPEAGAFDNSAAVKGEDVNGFTYLGFNLELIDGEKDYVYLRHHVLLDGITSVKVNGVEVTLVLVEGNYYYFDVKVEIGSFNEAHEISVGENTVVTASVYSYMNTAYASGALKPEQTNLLNALYQWDKAVADAKA